MRGDERLGEPGHERFGERGGILYDPAVPNGLEEALRRALAAGTAGLADMGRHNRERAARWDWDMIARMTLDAYAG